MRKGYTAAVAWAFGHIARAMVDGGGHPKTYSQLSAIQLGELLAAGAIKWVGGGATDPGRFDFDFEKMPAAVEALMKTVRPSWTRHPGYPKSYPARASG